MLFQQQRDLSGKQKKNVVSLKCILTLLYNTMESKNRHIAESINEFSFCFSSAQKLNNNKKKKRCFKNLYDSTHM